MAVWCGNREALAQETAVSDQVSLRLVGGAASVLDAIWGAYLQQEGA